MRHRRFHARPIASILRYLKLAALFFRVSVQNETAYRLDFYLRILVALFQLGGELMMLWIVFSNTRSLAGWNTWQVLVLMGVFRVIGGVIGMVIAPNMRLIMEDVRNGTLDFVLTKPINSQFYVSLRSIVIWRLVDIALGLALAIVGTSKLAASLMPAKLVLFVIMLASGALIIYSFWLALATSVFWFTRINNIEMVFWNIFEAGRYPVDVYRPWVRWTLTYILPIAFLVTFPAGILVDKTARYDALLACAFAIIVFAAATLFWRFGLRRYSGASA